MRLYLSLFLTVVLTGTGVAGSWVEGSYIVWLREGRTAYNILNQLPLGAKVSDTLSARLVIIQLEVPSTSNSDSILFLLEQHSDVYLAQREHVVTLRQVPNDTLWGEQWSIGAQPNNYSIQPEELWEAAVITDGKNTRGGQVVVGVIDNGYYLHKDLDLYTHPHERNGNGYDDDQNGYIDDKYGYNALTEDGKFSPANHGTQVAGIIGAARNNIRGIAGIAAPAKVLLVEGATEREKTVVESYIYLYEQRLQYNKSGGARGVYIVAINSSFGVDNVRAEDVPIWCELYDAMGSIGILNISATANEPVNVDIVGDIPTLCTSPYLLTVTNAVKDGTFYNRASYGRVNVDLAAPGFGNLHFERR